MTEDKPTIFWNEEYNGKAYGGYFVRNNLKEFFQRLQESGRTPVGIKFDGTYNLEIICVDPEREKEGE